MEFTVEYPVAGHDYDDRLLSAEGIASVAQRADELGFHALAFTEHPAPSAKWLAAGGHQTLDLVASLSFAAALTTHIRLMSYLLVAPYHNPYAAAKALATVDRLSAGRLTVVTGAGYLRSEFRALGIDFDNRNARFDEGLAVMRGLWREPEDFTHDGPIFPAEGVASLPGPVTPGGPPILIGGNSATARRRAAEAEGWSPLIASELVARTTRTPQLTVATLADHVDKLRVENPRAWVQVQTPGSGVLRGDTPWEDHSAHLAELAAAGVDQFVLQIPCTSVGAALEGLEKYAEAHLS